MSSIALELVDLTTHALVPGRKSWIRGRMAPLFLETHRLGADRKTCRGFPFAIIDWRTRVLAFPAESRGWRHMSFFSAAIRDPVIRTREKPE